MIVASRTKMILYLLKFFSSNFLYFIFGFRENVKGKKHKKVQKQRGEVLHSVADLENFAPDPVFKIPDPDPNTA